MHTDQYVAATAVKNQFVRPARSSSLPAVALAIWRDVYNGHMPGETFLNFIGTCHDGTDPQTWSIIGGALRKFHRSTTGEDRLRFEQLVRDLLHPHFQVLGWTSTEQESNERATTRGILAELLGTIGGDTEVRQMCARLFIWWQAQHQSVDDSLLPAIVNSIAETGTHAEYLTFLNLAHKAHSVRERQLLLEALGRFPSFDCNSAMNIVTTSVDKEQALQILTAYIRDEHSAASAWKYVKTVWRGSCFEHHFPKNRLQDLIDSLSSLDTPELQRDLNEFFRTYYWQETHTPIPSMLASVAANVHFCSRARQALGHYYAISAAKTKEGLSRAQA